MKKLIDTYGNFQDIVEELCSQEDGFGYFKPFVATEVHSLREDDYIEFYITTPMRSVFQIVSARYGQTTIHDKKIVGYCDAFRVTVGGELIGLIDDVEVFRLKDNHIRNEGLFELRYNVFFKHLNSIGD